MPVKRSDLCVSYKHVAPPKSPYAATSNITGLVNQSTPMMAMFFEKQVHGLVCSRAEFPLVFKLPF